MTNILKLTLIGLAYALSLCMINVLFAQELVTLSAPVTKPNQTTVRIERITLDVVEKSILVQFLGNNGEAGRAYYPTPAPPEKPGQPTGAQLLTILNTANLTTNSLVRRVLNRLQTDGYIGSGTIAGSPE